MSAQAIVRSASGARIDSRVAITTKNIADYLSSPQDVAVTQAWFRGAQFDVGHHVGISFSITARASVFENVFGVKLETKDDGSVSIDGRDDLELPLGALPRDVAERLVTVTFTPPADLHGSHGSTFP